MSNAAAKSTAMQTVRSGGFLWLNPIAMSVVNCNRAEVVECSCLKPCVGQAQVGDICLSWEESDSRTFAAGQRSEIGRYEDPWEVSLPGLGIGMINEDFHIARI